MQLTIAINVSSSNNADEERVMVRRVKTKKKSWLMIKQMKLKQNFFNHFIPYIKLLETSAKGSDFIFDCFYLLY